ncbi:M1 family metallopeptidase [Nocardioides daeguensis]|uniref:M1 family metallopeptidase n=1 Tax=Nocardioides daeguensis TaxID=908359 RepID=A0ABP6V6Y3_9ACTN|nr:M1 family metallopeptidase [Nocardioides daeguensis]MBV6726370.1 M1 family metallopeptidase [Nocardioides daeguensis]MCR1772213.1 M1 family metallopeptidase [Nocardioides daeguensis]
MRKSAGVLGVAACCLALAACAGTAPDRPAGAGRTASAAPTNSPSNTAAAGDLAIARSDTRRDTVYPEIGDPLVDALHYDLDLTWAPGHDRLSARETLTFRAAGDADRIPLDFNERLAISRATLDGAPAEVSVRGNDLTIAHPITADQQYELVLEYAGTPATAPAPSQRGDFAQGVGWSITAEHETWTLQEPYGAFTWYAVNDHPSDKALYDFTLTVPAPMAGVANGVLASTTTQDGQSINRWHLAEPAASYLVTVAFGDFQRTDLASASGVPIQVWTDADGDPLPGDTGSAPDAVDWLEQLLGPYPFDSFGVVVVDNDSGMETQTMVTLGDTPYSLSEAVLVHEAAHHWYGDTVTPADWSDVWMNEGMAMYLQGMWEAEQEGITVVRKLDQWADFESDLRAASGPPGAFDPNRFGDGNIYYGPALMWQELRERIGEKRFFEVLREWPAREANGTADRREYVDWIEETTGEELSSFFDRWLLDPDTPPRD